MMMSAPAAALRSLTVSAADDTDDFAGTTAETREEVGNIVESLVAALLRLAIAAIVFVVTVLVAKLVRRFLTPALARRRTASFGRVIWKLIAWPIVTAGVLIGVTAVFSSVKPVDLLGGLGIYFHEFGDDSTNAPTPRFDTAHNTPHGGSG